MLRADIYVRLNRVFRSVFDNDELVIGDETTADDIEDWDSLENINLVVALEKEFGIQFNMSDIERMQNVGEVADVILEKVGK